MAPLESTASLASRHGWKVFLFKLDFPSTSLKAVELLRKVGFTVKKKIHKEHSQRWITDPALTRFMLGPHRERGLLEAFLREVVDHGRHKTQG